MVVETLLNMLFGILNGLLKVLPNIVWNVEDEYVQSFLSIVKCVLYMFPMNTVIVIFGLTCTLMLFRIGIALVKTLWDLIPLA